MMPERLEVILSGVSAATLDLHGPGRHELRYTSDWLTDGAAFPISISLPLQSAPITGDVLSSFLDNLLPDNADVRERWALDAGLANTEPFHLLKAYGSDTAGALQFLDPDNPHRDVRGRSPLSDTEIGGRIRAIREDDTAWHGPDGEMGYFSLGGAQGKFSLGYGADGWYEPSGSDPSTHILKPWVRRQADGELIEYIAMTAARAAGLDAAFVSIREFDGEHSLVVERFDRFRDRDGLVQRAHQEDLAQSTGRTRLQKYESRGGPNYRDIIRLIDDHAPGAARGSSLQTFVRALVFSWMVLNTDAHAKNYSVFITPDGIELTPLYDISSLIPYVGHTDDTSRAIGQAMRSTKLSMRIAADYEAGEQSWFEWSAVAREAGIDRTELTAWAGAVAESLPALISEIAATLPSHLQTTTVARFVDRAPTRARQILSSIDGPDRP